LSLTLNRSILEQKKPGLQNDQSATSRDASDKRTNIAIARIGGMNAINNRDFTSKETSSRRDRSNGRDASNRKDACISRIPATAETTATAGISGKAGTPADMRQKPRQHQGC
jgi:hypothetical protein